MIKAGIIGDHNPSYIHHINTDNALHHAANCLSTSIEVTWLPTDKINREQLAGFDLLWCGPGSPYVSMDGALEGIRFARENNYPFIGTCGGFQHMVIEYARNVLGVRNAGHAETSPDSDTLFITPLSCSVKGQSREVTLAGGSLIYNSYGKQKIVTEQFHCNYGLNVEYRNLLAQNGLKISGVDDNSEVRVLELPTNDFFVATLYLPQSLSTVDKPHPLIINLLKAAETFRKNKRPI